MIINSNKLFVSDDLLAIDSDGKVLVRVCKFEPPIITAIIHYDKPFISQHIYLNYQKHHSLKFIKKERLC